MPAPDDVLVGVDGGATRTRTLVGIRGGERPVRGEGPPSLVHAAHPEAGAAALAHQIRDALARAGHQAPAHALCCALAGAGREEARQRVEAALREHGVASRVRVMTDSDAALWDAFHGGDGILLLSGTGSIAVASHAGRVVRAGGWGAVIGDEGSAYAIGRAALRAVARAHDGRGGATGLTRAVLHRTGCAAVEALIAWADGAAKADIAGLATCVLDAADDVVAAAILEGAAVELCSHVRALHARLKPWTGPPALAFAGGTLAAASSLRNRIISLLADDGVAVTPLDVIVDAARGALALAADL